VALIDFDLRSVAVQEPPETTPPLEEGAGAGAAEAGAAWDWAAAACCWTGAGVLCCDAEPAPLDPPDWGEDWLGADWGAASGRCRPSSLGPASGGICAGRDGVGEPLVPDAPAMLAVVVTVGLEAVR
jgi:hypothetical protein